MREIVIRYAFKHVDTGNTEFKRYSLSQLEEKLTKDLSPCFNVGYGYELIGRDEYTGLKDKNGTEICGGDIIRFCDFASDRTGGHMGDSIITGYVSYSYALWLVKENEDDENGFLLADAHLNDDELEVIGNIYENLELLEGQSCT